MNDGKVLEHVISLIEETMKDSPQTEVRRNYKIPNKSGNPREIDVLVSSVVNGYSIKIAIECKDYSSTKIPVEKIEAFHSKCSRIDGINKKVFVSRLGFQKDAIEAAKEFQIELITADKITSSEVQSWFPIKQLKLAKSADFQNVQLFCDLTEEELEKYDLNIDPKQARLKFGEDGVLTVSEALNKVLDDDVPKLWSIAIPYWMRAKEEDKLKPFPAPFKLAFSDDVYLMYKNEEIKLKGIVATVHLQLSVVDAKISDARHVTNESGDTKAKTIQVEFGEDNKGDIVIQKDSQAFYAKGYDGKLHRLKTLYSYDPKTDTFNNYLGKNEPD